MKFTPPFAPPWRTAAFVAAACGGLALLRAQTPPPPARRLPPAGIAIPAAARAELSSSAAAFRQEIDALAAPPAAAGLTTLLPDVEVFHKAVDWALRYDEFFDPKQIAVARRLLLEGRERAAQLRAGRAPWLEATGLVVRGYRSKLDGSVQPYGLFIPPNLSAGPSRLMVWLLGRGEKRTELAFIAERQAGPPQLTPASTIVLVPYGRFCNATKFAGEVDVFEAMDAVRARYQIDPLRITVAGFSMGGASTWHLGTHHSGLWCAASPGAGFAEVAVYTKAFAAGRELPTWWEQELWHWYEATSYAGNFFNCPTIAYSGEIDPQKQSADLMELAAAAEGLKLERLIGPQTAHKYHPETKKELTARLEALAAKGRDPRPREVRVTTYTLRYPRVAWVQIDGLARHWRRADARARLEKSGAISVETENVTALALECGDTPAVTIDGEKLTVPTAAADGASRHFVRQNGHWSIGQPAGPRRKSPGLTGPIDDAFMSAFVFVRPTGQPLNAAIGRWAQGEFAHATKMWRDIFRGDAPLADDTAVTADDIASKNLVLWGDPASNRVLAQLLARLPVTWDAQKLVFRGQTYDDAHHAPILIFPNPLNPQRYGVLYSGFDFREHACGTNALQIPKLPDYAIIDLRTPPGPRWPGRIVDAGFFDEEWR